jgi:hypothetical protein
MTGSRTRPRALVAAAFAFAFTLALSLIASTARLYAEDGLKTIDNPGGGQIVYGPLTGVSSLQNGMVFVLRTVHSHFDARPRVGRFFQARDSHSVATFFTVTARSQGGGAIAGLAIVSMAEGTGSAAGAVLYDDAARFPRSEPSMMKTLNAAWHLASARPPGRAPAGASAGTGSPGPGAAVEPAGAVASGAGPVRSSGPQHLRMATGGDRSASVGLPEGWKLTGVAGGQLTAEGPNGEMVALGILYQGIRNPGVRPPSFGGMARNAPLVAPFGGDLFSDFTSVTNQVRRTRHLPPGTFKLTRSENLPGNQQEQRVVQLIFEVDLHDGKGLRKGSARVGAMHVRGLDTWAMTVSSSNVPGALAQTEDATLKAIIRSYSQDGKVIARETSEVIGRINASARAAQIRANAQSAANDAHNSAFDAHMKDLDANSRAFDAHMDGLDRSSKSFQNYQLDREVIQDNDRNERGTVGNGYGDALVKTNPDRFQYVKQEDFIKGVDY